MRTMQKLINFLAVTSFIVSAGVVGGGVYLYKNQDAIIDDIKEQVTDAVKDLFSGSQLGSALVGGPSLDNEIDVTDEALGVDANPPVQLPSVPFGE